MGVRWLAGANGPKIFQMLLVFKVNNVVDSFMLFLQLFRHIAVLKVMLRATAGERVSAASRGCVEERIPAVDGR